MLLLLLLLRPPLSAGEPEDDAAKVIGESSELEADDLALVAAATCGALNDDADVESDGGKLVVRGCLGRLCAVVRGLALSPLMIDAALKEELEATGCITLRQCRKKSWELRGNRRKRARAGER